MKIHTAGAKGVLLFLALLSWSPAPAREPAAVVREADPSMAVVRKKKGLFEGWFRRKPEGVTKANDDDDDDDDDDGRGSTSASRAQPSRAVSGVESTTRTSTSAVDTPKKSTSSRRREVPPPSGRSAHSPASRNGTKQSPLSPEKPSPNSPMAPPDHVVGVMPQPNTGEVTVGSQGKETDGQASAPGTVVYVPRKAAEENQATKTVPKTPYGKPVPGRKGLVYPPGVPQKPENMIDVRDIPPGTKVRDPVSKTVFLVP